MILSQKQLNAISNHQPLTRSEVGLLQASIAIILRDGKNGFEFLLIQRAKHKDDPWSGQMAFPGGKVEANDTSKKATAIRETLEEVGIQLTEQDFIGQLDDHYGMNVENKNNANVSCFVFKLDRPASPQGNHEVADLVWLPMAYLDDPKHSHDFYHPRDNAVKMPAVLINLDREQILWGLSLRILSKLYELIDPPMRVLQDQTWP